MNDLAPSARRVYVVDDNESMRKSLERLISLSNWPVRAFDSAEAFLGEVDELPSGGRACLVLDVELPGMSGLDLLHRLTKMGRQLPTIVICGSDSEDTEREALHLGAIRFFYKPFDPQALLKVIARALG